MSLCTAARAVCLHDVTYVYVQIMPLSDAIKGFLIRQVNPRLNHYDKPLMLALLIGSFTLAIVAVLTAIQLAACPTTSFVSQDSVLGDMQTQNDHYTKVLETAGTQGGVTTSVTVCLKLSRELVAVTHPNYADSISAPSIVAYNPCSLDNAAMTTLGMSECTYDSAATVTNSQACTGSNLPCRPCGDVTGDGTNAFTMPTAPFTTQTEIVTTRRTCPSASTALGAALGYAAYIELVFTIIFVLGMTKAKVITPTYEGGVSLGGIVAGARGISQKEFEAMRAEMLELKQNTPSKTTTKATADGPAATADEGKADPAPAAQGDEKA